MKLIPKLQYGRLIKQKVPLILNEEGEAQWRDEHPDKVELPEVTITAERPLTTLEYRDKANAYKLGKLSDSSDASYKQLRDREHASLQNATKAGQMEGGLIGGLMSLSTITNPATIYAYRTMGVANLPNQYSKLKQDIKNGQYAGSAADAVLTGTELLPALHISKPLLISALSSLKPFALSRALNSQIRNGSKFMSRKVREGALINDDFDGDLVHALTRDKIQNGKLVPAQGEEGDLWWSRGVPDPTVRTRNTFYTIDKNNPNLNIVGSGARYDITSKDLEKYSAIISKGSVPLEETTMHTKFSIPGEPQFNPTTGNIQTFPLYTGRMNTQFVRDLSTKVRPNIHNIQLLK